MSARRKLFISVLTAMAAFLLLLIGAEFQVDIDEIARVLPVSISFGLMFVLVGWPFRMTNVSPYTRWTYTPWTIQSTWYLHLVTGAVIFYIYGTLASQPIFTIGSSDQVSPLSFPGFLTGTITSETAFALIVSGILFGLFMVAVGRWSDYMVVHGDKDISFFLAVCLSLISSIFLSLLIGGMIFNFFATSVRLISSAFVNASSAKSSAKFTTILALMATLFLISIVI